MTQDELAPTQIKNCRGRLEHGELNDVGSIPSEPFYEVADLEQ